MIIKMMIVKRDREHLMILEHTKINMSIFDDKYYFNERECLDNSNIIPKEKGIYIIEVEIIEKGNKEMNEIAKYSLPIHNFYKRKCISCKKIMDINISNWRLI